MKRIFFTLWMIAATGYWAMGQCDPVAQGTQTICYNTVPSTPLTVSAPGGSVSGYQWQQSPNGSTGWVNVTTGTGGTTASYTPPQLVVTTYYRCTVTYTGNCGIVNSNTVTITVHPELVAGTAGNDQIICYNTTPVQLTGGTASGGTGSYTYQWQSSPDNNTWNNITGATSANYTPGPLITTTYYCRAVTSGTCGTVHGNTVIITVLLNLVAGTAGNNQTICYNTAPAQLTGGTASGGTGSYTYQWQSSPNGTTWNNISGATSANYTPGPLTTTTHYRRAVTSGTCGTVYSDPPVEITVHPNLVAGTAGSNQTICYNTTPAQLTGGTASGGTGTYTYQWQSSPNGTTWNNITGATSENYSPGSLTTTTHYRRAVTSETCGTVYGNTVTITVHPDLVAGTAGSNQTICYNTAPAQITGGTASGGTGSYTYQWQSSPDNNTWNNISGATSANYSPGPLTTTTHYRRAVTSGTCGTVYSNPVKITVLPNLVAGTAGNNQTICYNTTPAQLTGGTASGGTGTYTYQWQSSPNGTTWNNISGATSANYSPGSLTTTTYYRRAVTSGTCGTVYGNTVTIFVHPNLVAGTAGSNQTICYNTAPEELTGGTASGGTGNYTYQWQSSPNGTTWNNISGATSANYTPDPLTTTTYYRRAVTSETCGTVYSNTVTVSIVFPPSEPTIIGSANVCPGSINISYEVSENKPGETYTWYVNGAGWIIPGSNIGYKIAVNAGTADGTVTVIPSTSICGNGTPGNKPVTVSSTITPFVRITITEGSNVTCLGTPITFSVDSIDGGGTPTYQWKVNGGNVGTGMSYTYNNNNPVNNVVVACVMTSSESCAVPETAIDEIPITINTPPTAPTTIITSSNTICIGSDAVITVSGGNPGTSCKYELWGKACDDTGTLIDSSLHTTETSHAFTVKNLPTGSHTFYARRVGTSACTNITDCINTTISVITVNTISSTPYGNYRTLCINTPLSTTSGGDITFATTGATGATISWTPSRPNGITDRFEGDASNGTVTISGTPSVSGNFDYTVTLTGGCGTVTATGSITVNLSPVLNAIDNITLCTGATQDPITFSGDNVAPDSCIWTNSNPAIGLDASGTGEIPEFEATNNTDKPITATITVMPISSLGCAGQQKTFTITVSSAADLKLKNIIAKTDKDGKPYMLVYPKRKEDPEFKYQWYENGDSILGATMQYYYPNNYGRTLSLQDSVYKVRIWEQGKEGCYGETPYYKYGIISTPPTSYLFSIIPNPNRGSFTVIFNKELIEYQQEEMMLKISSLTGEIIWEQKIKGTDDIAVNQLLSPGSYIVTITTSDRQSFSKTIIVSS